MGDVVVLSPCRRMRPGDGDSSSFHLPYVWPHPRRLTLTIEQARAIDRDIRHLDAVMERARDIATLSTILSTICGAGDKDAILAARAIQRWLSTGRIN